ncbi:MAG TPA: glycoside hydrolase family 3 N-terminal domain-containing protein [Candidatus Polarisedimenticolia bacterium]|nr:glycoside hydrolase family 3 N-terminal domain-containing protein [Candidatus Polarisedimenticolia bacterium]
MQRFSLCVPAHRRYRILALLAASNLAAFVVPASPASDADSLLAKMTLDEKIGQMVQVDMAALKDRGDVQKYFLGSVLSGGGSDPADNRPETWLQAVTEIRAEALKTRLKIPLLYGIDAVHGHNNVLGATIFPHHIGLGATGNAALVQKAEHITAEEVAGTGIQWAFAPCVAVSRDIRWGRSYESFGQSPELVSEMGVASVRGFQGDHLNKNSILACVKHFAGDGGTENGKDQGNDVCDEATFRKLYLAPYAAAIKAGAQSIMVSYSSWNGEKMHGNKHLLTDVLKNEMGFQGFLVSDWAAIDQLSPDYKSDIATSINAGLDMIMIPFGPGEKNNYQQFIADLKDLVASGKVSQGRIDDAVRRILRVKFEMGLFKNSATDPALTAAIGSPRHRKVARECVSESLVLLKNSNQVLPLKKSLKAITVAGKAADDLGMQCGGWTIDWQGKTGNVTTGGTTLLAAIKKTVGPRTKVVYSPDGSNLGSPDVVIVTVGEQPYAEFKGDRQDLNLSSEDAALIAKTKAAHVPVVTVLYSGRPLVLGAALEQTDAFVAAWLPGSEGEGITDVLFGDQPFVGKLPRLWPANNNQLCVDHVEGTPLFPVGYGLTYGYFTRN